jgi:hypothetical protein
MGERLIHGSACGAAPRRHLVLVGALIVIGTLIAGLAAVVLGAVLSYQGDQRRRRDFKDALADLGATQLRRDEDAVRAQLRGRDITARLILKSTDWPGFTQMSTPIPAGAPKLALTLDLRRSEGYAQLPASRAITGLLGDAPFEDRYDLATTNKELTRRLLDARARELAGVLHPVYLRVGQDRIFVSTRGERVQTPHVSAIVDLLVHLHSRLAVMRGELEAEKYDSARAADDGYRGAASNRSARRS